MTRRQAAKQLKLAQRRYEHAVNVELPRLSAAHEAGHCAMALHCGCRVHKVWIGSPGKPGAHIQYWLDVEKFPMLSALISLAGPLMGRQVRDDADEYCQKDFEDLDKAIVQMLPDATAAERATKRQVIEALVIAKLDELAPEVGRIAAALLEKRVLAEDEIKAAYRGGEQQEAAA